MILTIGNQDQEFFVGDSFVTTDGKEYLVISAEGFDLSDEGMHAEFIIVDVKYGDMQGYEGYFFDIPKNYNITKIIPNNNSLARRK